MDVGKKLVEIQNELIDENPFFPKNMCSLSAKQIYDQLGFSPVAGYVLTSNGLEKHSWNIDSDGKIVDITLYQFNESVDKVIHSKKEDLMNSWGYFEDKKSTEALRKYINNFGKNFSL